MRVDQNTISFKQASHRCETCGAKLSSHLKWRKGASEVAIFFLILLVVLAAYEASKQLPAISPAVRTIALGAIMGGVFSFFMQQCRRALEFRLWEPKP